MHCTEVAAPRCDANSCEGCVASEDCAHFTEETICDEGSGACVACLGEDDCGGNVCHPTMKTCTDLPARELHACEPCQHDSQCREGLLCVETMYDAPEARVVGTFCLWRVDAPQPGPNGSCTNAPPFVRPWSTTSVDGQSALVCELRTTTCPALLHHAKVVEGCESPFTDDDACGHPDFNDGRCRHDSNQNPRCTYACLGHQDCQGGSSCPATGDRYCSI